MMNSLISTFMDDPICYGIIVCSLLLYIYRTKDLRSLALLGLPFLGEFISLVQNVIVLVMAAIIFAPKTRPLMLLLIASSLLAPTAIKAFVYPIIMWVLMEDFLGGEKSKSYGDSLLGLILIYGTRDLLKGVDGHLISSYIAIIFSLRMIFFMRNTLQTIKSFYIVLALVSLALASSELALTLLAAASLLVALLQMSCDQPKAESFDCDMASKFYTDPKYFTLALAALALGPILLLSALMISSPLYGICFLVILITMSYRSLCLLAQGLIVEGENKEALPLGYLAILCSYSVLVFLLFIRREQLDSWASILITWFGILSAIAIGYMSLRLTTKQATKSSVMLKVAPVYMERFQVSVEFATSEVLTAEINPRTQSPGKMQFKELLNDLDFPYVILTFIILVIGLILILREAPL